MIARFESPGSRTILLLSVLILAAFGLDTWQSAAQRAGRRMWLNELVGAVSHPLELGLSEATSRIRQGWVALAHGRRLARENRELAAKTAALESQVVELEEACARLDREEELLASYGANVGYRCLARVTALGSGGWVSYLVVDRGSADGVRQKDVAVSREGVVGQVYAVTAHTARVVPLTDLASGISVLIQRSRETGTLKGLGKWKCEVRYLHPDASVRPGDQVLTTGTGGIFPKGLRVGTVTSVSADPNTPGKLAQVEPATEFRKVEEVLLLRAAR